MSVLQQPTAFRPPVSDDTFKIRIVTPVLARAHPNTNTIPTMRGSVTSETTLRQLRSMIASHVGVEIGTSIPHHEECNCSFARHVDLSTTIRDTSNEGSSSTKLVVISGTNNVALLDLEPGTDMNRASLISRVRAAYGEMIDLKVVNLIGGDLAGAIQ